MKNERSTALVLLPLTCGAKNEQDAAPHPDFENKQVPVPEAALPPTHLFHQEPLLFLVLLVSGLQVPLKLRLHGLHVDLEAKLGVFRGLKFILQLFQLRPHLVHLLLQGPLGLFQFVHLQPSKQQS